MRGEKSVSEITWHRLNRETLNLYDLKHQA